MGLQLLHIVGASTACHNGGFLFFPPWYEYLSCDSTGTTPVIANINDVWLIVAAVVDILLRLAAIIAVVFIIWSGVDYMTSQGEPDKVAKARQSMINALVGLAISMLAAGVINFIAGKVQ